MCLIIKGFKTEAAARKASNRPKIAKKDIPVFKVLKTNSYSPFWSFKYEKGFHYYQEGKEPFKFDIYSRTTGFRNDWRISIEEGLHAYTNEKAAKSHLIYSDYTKIVKMIVPKGAKYFINYSGDEIVASDLIYPHK